MANDRLEQLLDLWMADRDCGIIRTASEICTENPELVEELSRRIEIVRRFEHLADVDHSETLVSQGSVDTSHLTNAPVPTALKPTTMPGSIGPFRPLELLGEGGMGAVYLAEDPQLGRRVAVKVMKKELAADSDARHRFLREARAMATVEHDNIMTIYAVGEDQGMPYLVMPVLKGETLDDRLRRESRLSADETRRIGEEIAAGLAAAHSHGLIHRDIKPSNIWLEGTQGRVRILDFGLARPANDDQKVTHSGAVLGTPAYMAPEQAAGAAATPRSDLFSLGAVLYRMTTGVQPFAGPNIMATLSNLANKQPEPPRKICPEVPESLSELILRLIAKPPEDRPESAAIVVESLQPTLETVVPHFTFSPSPVRSRKKPAGRPSVDQPLNKVASSTRPPRTFRKGLAAGFAGFLVLMSIIVYRIQTDKGVLIVSIDDEQVAAKLTKGGLEIEDAKTGRTWTIKPDQPESVSSGEYKISPPDGLLLYVTDDTGTEFTTAEFKIKRGDQITVRVTREEPEGSVVVNPEWNGWPKDAPAPAIAPFDAAQAKRHQEEWAKHLGVPVEYTNSIGMKFVLIPPGEFLMGSTSAEIEDLLTQIADAESVRDRLQMESPQHRVVLTKAFYLGVHEVTQAQFAGVMGNNPSFHSSTGGGKDLVLQIDTSAYPVEQVSWNDTTEFCRRLSLQENVVPATSEPNRDSTTPNGSGYWLPTEAEWEFACRAGTTTWFWNGNEIENLKTIDLFGPTTGQVGQLKANPFGVHDLHGNVCEFVHDCWDPDSYKKHSGEPAIDPIGGVPEAHVLTLYRGSHWSGCDESARSAARKVGYERSTPVASHLGFRVKLPWTTVKEFLRSGNSRLHSAAGHSPQVPVDPSPFDAMSHSRFLRKNGSTICPKMLSPYSVLTSEKLGRRPPKSQTNIRDVGLQPRWKVDLWLRLVERLFV
ncbi:MAG: bifunctional serine/threonine-protein kinase/formylglycine-generating enzyme family protein [Planctomycetaceae bacterium]